MRKREYVLEYNLFLLFSGVPFVVFHVVVAVLHFVFMIVMVPLGIQRAEAARRHKETQERHSSFIADCKRAFERLRKTRINRERTNEKERS